MFIPKGWKGTPEAMQIRAEDEDQERRSYQRSISGPLQVVGTMVEIGCGRCHSICTAFRSYMGFHRRHTAA